MPMKNIPIIFLLLSMYCGQAQTSIPRFGNLVRLGELYSSDVNGTGDNFKKTADSLRTPELSHIIDALIAIGQGDRKLLTSEFLKLPDNKELKLWYVLREIHYNNQSKNKEPRSNEIVARETLEKHIDERWLIDNYYYRINTGIGKLFNTEDLKDLNIDSKSCGLKNDTERAILYFNLNHALTTRFVVLQAMKNYDRLLEFAAKLPTFDSRPYFEYKEFDFKDFDWIGYEKVESYKERHIGGLYTTLIAHFAAANQKALNNEARLIYFGSILSVPEYFKYSTSAEILEDLYKRSNK
jgi:hypothetical protein